VKNEKGLMPVRQITLFYSHIFLSKEEGHEKFIEYISGFTLRRWWI
jgi:hypothetical protein